jgi:hypothetical protein
MESGPDAVDPLPRWRQRRIVHWEGVHVSFRVLDRVPSPADLSLVPRWQQRSEQQSAACREERCRRGRRNGRGGNATSLGNGVQVVVPNLPTTGRVGQ